MSRRHASTGADARDVETGGEAYQPPVARESGSSAGRVGEFDRADRGKRRGRTRVRGSMVPEAEFVSYYGRPILKRPTWKNPDVPLYLWVGGMAGSSAGLAALGDVTGRPGLRRWGRVVAAGGAMAGTVALVHDLGRPERFLRMLRVAKPTSPLSVGTWILSPFAAFASAALASEITGIAPRLGRLAGWGAAALGPPLASYTGVLLADTAVPAWHEAHRELPALFAGSAAAAGGGAMLVAAGLGGRLTESGPAARVAATGAVVELGADALLRARLRRLPGGIERAYSEGRPGRWHRAAEILTALGAGGAVASLLTGHRPTGRRLTGRRLTDRPDLNHMDTYGMCAYGMGAAGGHGRRRAGRRALWAPPLTSALALLGRRPRHGADWPRALAVGSGLALAAGSLATRFSVFEAGLASAVDPAHVVAPQRERLERGERASAHGSWLAERTSPVPRS